MLLHRRLYTEGFSFSGSAFVAHRTPDRETPLFFFILLNFFCRKEGKPYVIIVNLLSIYVL
uniref:Uncharacterized protein n=1 Tax=Anguilla anguilla TaxID=7936 RepID=A0A0E9WCQ9_ANGAN